MAPIGYVDLLRALGKHGVRYRLVGGMAVILLGIPRTTKDIDLLVDFAPENVARLCAALDELGYRPKAPIRVADLAEPAKRAEWARDKGMMALMLWRDGGKDLDVLTASPVTCEEAGVGGRMLEVDGVPVPVASVEALIRMKRAAGRKQDLSDIAALEQLQRLLAGRGDGREPA